MIKVLSLLGSPRKKHNTDHLLEAVLKGTQLAGAHTQKICLKDLNYQGCIACESCYHTGKCKLKDDFSPIYTYLDQAEIIIVASPIYFLSVPAQLKAAIDRTQALWASKYILEQPTLQRNKKRFGIFLATGGAPAPNNSPLPALSVIKLFFKAINTEYYKDIIVYNTDHYPITENSEILVEAQKLGFQAVKEYKDLIKK